MKMSVEDFRTLAINIDKPLGTGMRDRWNALWRAVDAGRISYDILRPYNDAHIDTALRKIQNGNFPAFWRHHGETIRKDTP